MTRSGLLHGRQTLPGFFALLALAGCVPKPLVRHPASAPLLAAQDLRERKLAGVDHWTMQGRLGVSDGKDGGSGSLEWTRNGDRYSFVLRAPITGKSFRLSGGLNGATLEGLDGGPLQGPDAQALMRRALGWEVPLADLQAWVLGLRASGSSAQLAFGADGLPSLLQQDGWSVAYRRWDTSRQPALPTAVFASKPPYKVRLSVESWSLTPAAR